MSTSNINNVNYKGNKAVALVLALIFPFFIMIYSHINHNKKWAKNAFWLSYSFLGLIFIYNSVDSTADYVRYAELFENIQDLIPSYSYIFDNLFSAEESFTKDPFMPLLMYTLSFISKNPKLYFFVFSIIYGFFFSRNLWFLFDKLPSRYNRVVGILIIFYTLIVPFYGYARIWLAIHVFLYGALPYIYNNDKSKLIWIFMSFFIHYTILFMIIALFGYRFVPKNINVLLNIFLGTFLISELNLSQLNSFLSNILPFMSEGIDSYVNEGYREFYSDREFSMAVFISSNSQKIAIIGMTITNWIIIKNSEIKIKGITNMFTYALYIYSISNIIALIPSGGRYIFLSQFFLIISFILVMCYYPIDAKLKKYQNISYLFLFPILFSLRQSLDFFGFSILYGNYLNFFLIDDVKTIMSYF